MVVESTLVKVLVLEDNEFFLKNIFRQLRELDCEVVAATNIEDARKEMERSSDFYAAILDKSVREHNRGPEIKNGGLIYALELREKFPDLKIALWTCDFLQREGVAYLREKNIIYMDKNVEKQQLRGFLES